MLVVPVGEPPWVGGYLSLSWRSGKPAPEDVPVAEIAAIADVLVMADERSRAEVALAETEEPDLFIDGIENLLHIPEMIEAEQLKKLLHLIDEKKVLVVNE